MTPPISFSPYTLIWFPYLDCKLVQARICSYSCTALHTHNRQQPQELAKNTQSHISPHPVLSSGPFDRLFHDSFDFWFEKLVWYEKIRDSHAYQGIRWNEYKIQGRWAMWPAGWEAHQQDSAPRVFLAGYTTIMEGTGPAMRPTNAPQCTCTGWPHMKKRMGLSIFLLLFWGKQNPGRSQFANKRQNTFQQKLFS